MPVVTDLTTFYLKGGARTKQSKMVIDRWGPYKDRALMAVAGNDPTQMLTQRNAGDLARIQSYLDEEGFRLEAPGFEPLLVPRDLWERGDSIQTRVHAKGCLGVDQGPLAAAWMSAFLGRSARLLYMPDSHRREPSRLPPGVDSALKFADGSPFLCVRRASLVAFNRYLVNRGLEPVSMERFRGNGEVDDMPGDDPTPFAEETWNEFCIAGVHFFCLRLCVRCKVITLDPLTGEQADPHVLSELTAFHSGLKDGKNRPLFGVNLVHDLRDFPEGTAIISVGDLVEDIKYGPRPEL